MEAGNHQIEARKENYKTECTTVNVIQNIPKKIEFQLSTSELGTLQIMSDPNDAVVVIDGKIENSKKIELKAGTHHVTISKPEYTIEEFNVYLYPNQVLNVKKKLFPQNNLCIKTKPSGALVYIDDRYVGYSPLNIKVPPGSHKVTAQEMGYLSEITWIHIDNNSEVKTLNLNLSKRKNNSSNTTSKNSYSSNYYYTKKKSYEDLYIKQAEFYLQLGYNQGDSGSLNYGIGCFYKRFNAEFNMKLNPDNGNSLDLKIGVAIPTGFKFRITPQFGFAWSGNDGILYALPAEIRFNLAFSRWFGIYASPGYNIPIKKWDDVLDGVWGFNGSIGFYVSL